MVYTFFLGVGVFRLARKKALVRRAVAVENIGRITCIVSDKTGTITAGSLVLAHRVPAAGHDEASVLRVATFAARPDSGDPLDQALHAASGRLPAATRLADFPFTEARRRETVVWRLAANGPTAFTKGAPETVLATSALSAQERADWLARVEEFARSGHKVIACARREMPEGVSTHVEPEDGFTFAGLLAFEDPVRQGVREAIADCMAAGMRVIMVTGDHPATARAIAREIGLGGADPKVVVLSSGRRCRRCARRQRRRACGGARHPAAEARAGAGAASRWRTRRRHGRRRQRCRRRCAWPTSAWPWASAARAAHARWRRWCCSTTTSGPSSMRWPKAASCSRTCGSPSPTCCWCTCRS